jgi:hypothetical protein
MAVITLTRSGDAPLQFAGELVAEADSRARNGPGQSRWFTLQIYRTECDQWVAAIGYRTQWQSEVEQDFVHWSADGEAVRGWLKAFDPCSPEIWQGRREDRPGSPEENMARSRNEYDRREIRRLWRTAAAQALGASGIVDVLDYPDRPLPEDYPPPAAEAAARRERERQPGSEEVG